MKFRPKFSLRTLLAVTLIIGAALAVSKTWAAWYLQQIKSFSSEDTEYFEKIDGPMNAPDGKRVAKIANEDYSPYTYPNKKSLVVIEDSGVIIAEFKGAEFGCVWVQFTDDDTLRIKEPDPNNEWNSRFSTYKRRHAEGILGHLLSIEPWLLLLSIIFFIWSCLSDFKRFRTCPPNL